jgi:hypothetical protein
MAALTADRNPPVTKVPGMILDLDVAASEVIYKGAFVEIDAGGDITASGVGTAQAFAIAQEQANNASGSDGDIRCKCMIGSIFEHAIASITKASIGSIVYASDDQTLTLVSTANNFVGWVVQVQDTGTALVKHAYAGEPSA